MLRGALGGFLEFVGMMRGLLSFFVSLVVDLHLADEFEVTLLQSTGCVCALSPKEFSETTRIMQMNVVKIFRNVNFKVVPSSLVYHWVRQSQNRGDF
jgi:hypothetical protein